MQTSGSVTLQMLRAEAGFRSPVTAALSVCLLLAAWGDMHRAVAQSSELPVLSAPGSIDLPAPADPEPDQSPVDAVGPTSVDATTNYWILSTRRCPQKTESGLCCRPDVYRVDECGRMHGCRMEEFNAAMDPGRPLCIMTHGSFVDWESMLSDSRRTFNWLQQCCGQSLQVVFFTWPSDEFQSPFVSIDVELLGHRSAVNGFYLARVIAELPAVHRITLIGHSHGARVSSAALHLLSGGVIRGFRLGIPYSGQHRLRAIFAAAAVDHDWLNPDERYARALHCVECVVNLTNRHDAALLIYPLRRPFSSRALGQTGLTQKDRRKLGRHAIKYRDLDVSHIIKSGHIWPHYYSQPTIARSIAPYLYSWGVTTTSVSSRAAVPPAPVTLP